MAKHPSTKPASTKKCLRSSKRGTWLMWAHFGGAAPTSTHGEPWANVSNSQGGPRCSPLAGWLKAPTTKRHLNTPGNSASCSVDVRRISCVANRLCIKKMVIRRGWRFEKFCQHENCFRMILPLTEPMPMRSGVSRELSQICCM